MQIAWTRQADQDVDQIFDYLKQFDSKTATETMVIIKSSVIHLKSFPEIGRNGRVDMTREFPIPRIPYTIVYRIVANVIEIISILHQSRQWPEDFG